MTMHRHTRGFSLLELITCSCLVVLLGTLLFPLLLTAQVSSNMKLCQNNMRKLGLAMHNYHDTFRLFPPGWVTKNRASLDQGGLGWQAMLLPYIDQARLYQRVNFNMGFGDSADAKSKEPLRTVLKEYRCPADGMGATNPFRDNWPASNYSGNFGHRPLPCWSTVPGKSFWPGIVVDDPAGDPMLWPSGILWANSRIGIANVTDGTSNTIMIGERATRSAAGIWPGVTRNSQPNDAVTDGSHASRLNQSVGGYSSNHADLNFLMCDGAVRVIKSTIDSKPATDMTMPLGIFQRLVSRRDGQPVNEF